MNWESSSARLSILLLALFVGCGHVSKVAPVIEKILKAGKGASTVVDDVVKSSDDVVSNSSKLSPTISTAARGTVHSARAIYLLKKQYDVAYSDQQKEKRLYSQKIDRLHPDDQKLMTQRISSHDSIFEELRSALKTPEQLPEDGPSRITTFLEEFQTDSRGIQSLLSGL